jgi:Tfp pilus assembly PilM family ATPase
VQLKFRDSSTDLTHQETKEAMDFLGGLSSGVLNILSFAILAACVLKVFQIAVTLTEIKDLLKALNANASIQSLGRAPMAAQVPIPSAQSGEEMLRALSLELDHPVDPTSIELGKKS